MNKSSFYDGEVTGGDNHMETIERLLIEIRDGDAGTRVTARNRLFELAYCRLIVIARGELRAKGIGKGLERTIDLLHDMWLTRLRRTLENPETKLNDAKHFYALSASMIRQTLIEWNRKRRTTQTEIDFEKIPETPRNVERDQVIEAISDLPEELRELADMRIVHGYTSAEVAKVWQIDRGNVNRRFLLVKERLMRMLES
jgi:RNA polymerase sigma factor (sigma-70 family)